MDVVQDKTLRAGRRYKVSRPFLKTLSFRPVIARG